jgi:FtsZ-interacting cell division protein ZipA
MSELRLILLVAGVLFIAGIAGFEWWRGRRGRALGATAHEDMPAEMPSSSSKTPLPDINVVRDARVMVSDNLPVIELASTSASGTRRALGIAISDEVAVDVATDNAEPSAARNEPYIGQDDEISQVRVFDEQPVHGPQLVLAWPKEEERRIVALRVVPHAEPRFAGRALRQAFASAGFWHGPLDIYHLPDARGGRGLIHGGDGGCRASRAAAR